MKHRMEPKGVKYVIIEIKCLWEQFSHIVILASTAKHEGLALA